MSSLHITLASVDPPDGPVVVLATEGTSKVHKPAESGDRTRCGRSLEGKTSGWLRGEWRGHSDLCKSCFADA